MTEVAPAVVTLFPAALTVLGVSFGVEFACTADVFVRVVGELSTQRVYAAFIPTVERPRVIRLDAAALGIIPANTTNHVAMATEEEEV